MKGTQRELPNTIGGRIQRLRILRNLTQGELAKEMGVKRETINQWESETRDLKTKSTIMLADFYNVSCDYILRGVEAENIDFHKMTGLSDAAIKALEEHNNSYKSSISSMNESTVTGITILNMLLEDELSIFLEDILDNIPNLFIIAENAEACKPDYAEPQEDDFRPIIIESLVIKHGMRTAQKCCEPIELDPIQYYLFSLQQAKQGAQFMIDVLVEKHLSSINLNAVKERISECRDIKEKLNSEFNILIEKLKLPQDQRPNKKK